MYQRSFNYTDEKALRADLQKLKQDIHAAATPPTTVLFHVYSDTKECSLVETVLGILRDEVPGATYVGCSSNANVTDGLLVGDGTPAHASVICNIFEDPDTTIEIMQLDLDYSSQRDTAEELVKAVAERPWVKAVEMLATGGDVQLPDFCADVSVVRPDIVFFGGVAFCSESIDSTSHFPYVLSSTGEISDRGVVFVLYGGENLHAMTQALSGWKPLGRPIAITKSHRSILYELDGRPAYETYAHYLKIANDENFSQNSLIFPLSFDKNGMLMIKSPLGANEDGSLIMTSDISKEHSECRIAYGDPATILNSVAESAQAMRAFAPDAILVFTCASRLVYWGPEYVNREFQPFQAIAPSSGFFTGSEFARYQGDVLQHNVTLVMAGLREGEPRDLSDVSIEVNDTEFSRQMAIVNSLTAFVGVTSAELQDAYDQMEYMAKVDGLTGLANRREIELRIEKAIDEFANSSRFADDRLRRKCSKAPSVIMFDLDDFKTVNDAYGHKAGDDVLKKVGELSLELIDNAGVGTAGRWGGEEFMIVLPHAAAEDAMEIAERLRAQFEMVTFPLSGTHTLSVGVAQALPGESADLLCSRADKALYAAKKSGKNRVVPA